MVINMYHACNFLYILFLTQKSMFGAKSYAQSMAISIFRSELIMSLFKDSKTMQSIYYIHVELYSTYSTTVLQY